MKEKLELQKKKKKKVRDFNSKKSSKVCIDISEQEANYLLTKINNIIAKNVEVSL